MEGRKGWCATDQLIGPPCSGLLQGTLRITFFLHVVSVLVHTLFFFAENDFRVLALFLLELLFKSCFSANSKSSIESFSVAIGSPIGKMTCSEKGRMGASSAQALPIYHRGWNPLSMVLT